MRSKKVYYSLLIIVLLVYVIEWFVNNVYLRILAGSVMILAISLYPVATAKSGDDKGKTGDGSLS